MKRSQLREAIARANDRKVETIKAGTYAGWEFDVYIKMVSGQDAAELGKVYSDTKATAGDNAAQVAFTNLLLVRSIVDEDGGRVFNDDEANLIVERGHEVVQDLVVRCLALSKLDKKASESAVKSSGEGPTG